MEVGKINIIKIRKFHTFQTLTSTTLTMKRTTTTTAASITRTITT